MGLTLVAQEASYPSDPRGEMYRESGKPKVKCIELLTDTQSANPLEKTMSPWEIEAHQGQVTFHPKEGRRGINDQTST